MIIQHKEDRCKQHESTLGQSRDIYIDLLHNKEYPNGVVNIVTGKVVVNPFVNVADSVRHRKEQMEELENSWPEDSMTESVSELLQCQYLITTSR